jgi:hypothetical protein
MNRYLRAAAILLLGVLIIEVSHRVGGTSGGLLTALGGVVMLYSIVELLRKRF